MLFFIFISCTKKINLQKIILIKTVSNVKSFIKKHQLVKKLFNRVILSKLEVFGKYFVNKSETKKMVGRKVVPLDVINHPLQCSPKSLDTLYIKKVGIFHVEYSRDWLSRSACNLVVNLAVLCS